jgi:hypothetical protein
MYYKGTNRICNLEAQDEKTSKYNNKNQEKRMDLRMINTKRSFYLLLLSKIWY